MSVSQDLKEMLLEFACVLNMNISRKDCASVTRDSFGEYSTSCD